MPTLIVLRHAKAVAGLGLADIDRPLNDRGRRDAAATGEWLRKNDLVPDRVLCSTAVRTRETLEGLALQSEVSFEPQIYDNEPETLLSLVREAGDVRTLLLIGHNPSVHQLVHDLTRDAPDAFPTCALAVIEFTVPWAEVWPGTGTLSLTRTPKD
ncbi:SixA phosphatase family protein [Actinomadura rudentiformis]|uniref:Histidine phosphatase family protein n=1 Tax=Actinomadura rudentiformis TaxID=359158 RepID=A0A6H9ZA73_9ACTN|nr:histidine phosphatase family protein [Actinomadura rudentiformis]KAB2351024.1 histidine phosphatase family protein [Actinomadura rudentiformis]